MARELILIPKKKYDDLLSDNKNKGLHENNSQQNDNLPEKGSDESTEKNLNDASNKDMKGGELYIKRTPTDFAKDLRAKPIRRKWLSFKM